ncbi:hypothetical protein OAY12_00215 [Candidatus Pelagibacter sp.]|nr:hypothetical protein [Candidatus Pelagibacter sp.]
MKIFIKIIASLIFFLSILVIYMSLVGFETKRFNSQIIKKVENINNNLKIELNEIKIILDPFNFKLKAKTIGSKLKNKNKILEIQSIKIQIPIRSLFSEKTLTESAEISTETLKIKDLISFIRVFNRGPEFYLLENIIDKGFLIADIKLNFDKEGNIKNDYKINGFVKDTNINILKKYKFKKLNFGYEYKNSELALNNISFSLNDLKLDSRNLNINKLKDEFLIRGELNSKDTELNDKNFNLLVKPYLKNLDFDKIKFSSNNKFSFKISKKFRVKDFLLDSDLELKRLSLLNKFNLKKIFPNIKKKIRFDNHKIKINYNKKILQINGVGKILLQENNDELSYSLIRKEKNFSFKSNIKINNNPLILDFMNFKKKKNSKLIIEINGTRNSKNTTQLDLISFKENENKLSITNLTLNEKFNVIDLEAVKAYYVDQDNIQNKFAIKMKNNIYRLEGLSLNINKLVDNLINNDEKSNILKKNFKLDININKLFLDKETSLNKFIGTLTFNNQDIVNGKITGQFSNNKKLKFTVETNNEEKITTLFLDKAVPIVNRYKFIKGFEEGVLDFYSTKKGKNSFSTVKIYDFKLKELPALTKLLTLASLQGIADILSGEGIRFNEFEMNFRNQGDLMTIEEIYAIGPAISVLMSGYVEKNKLISLRGTLVPATTINKAIGSIPVLGKILVGSKTGEGVFGVSFKIKGPPKNLETTVNPIKTLTPRFITRTLEKIKKN